MAAAGTIEIPVPLGGGIWFALKVPAGADLRRAHFDQFRRYVTILESALASDDATAEALDDGRSGG